MKQKIKIMFCPLVVIGILSLLTISCKKDDSKKDGSSTSNQTVTDKDGNVYTTVKIGSQTWTVENLRSTKYNDGTAITKVAKSTEWLALTTAGFCYYNNTTNADSIKMFGALYNWYAVDTKKLAPEGWHVPANTDWDTLINYLIANKYNWTGSNEGNRVGRSLALSYAWEFTATYGAVGNNNPGASNRSGFSALPGGWRVNGRDFFGIGSVGVWWSNTSENDSEINAFCRILRAESDNTSENILTNKSDGLSVRLVKD